MGAVEAGRETVIPDEHEGERANEGGAATLASSIYLQMRDDIVAGRLAPGAPLRLKPLQARYGAGMSPIREALSRLASDTFVVSFDHRGFRVADISRGDLADLTEARVLIECEALRQSIAVGDEDWETGVVAAHYRLGKIDARLKEAAGELLESWELANQQFHDALAAACTSRWIQRFRQLLYDQSKRYRQFSLLRSVKLRRIKEEHEQLKEAALARDGERATRLLAEHIRATSEFIMRRLQTEDDSERPRR